MVLSFVKNLWEKRIVRFLVVGTFNTFLDISLLLFLYEVVGLPKVLANTISVPTAITVSYFLNHRIVFRQKQGYSLSAYLKFLAITGFSAVVIQDAVIFIITDHLLHPGNKMISIAGNSISLATVELIGAKIVGIGIGLFWNFVLYKYIVFNNDNNHDKADEIIVA
ncbi:MAG TPA: GtrA family protein [Patescibacteria group bacterium]|nr:GtrA family protein [Patescibacteria group bacterium]